MKILLLLLIVSSAFSQSDSTRTLRPSGIFPVGTITYEWTDATRTVPYSSYPSDKRKIITQFWYPASKDSLAKTAPYNALSKDYRHVTSHSKLMPAFAVNQKNVPLIVFCPGRGVERFGYTSLAEELASQGYVVAAIDMPLIGYVYYPDGYVLLPSTKYRAPRGLMAGPYEKVDEFYQEPTQMGTEDVSFIINRIEELNKVDNSGRFVGKINLNNVGLFAHSLGGRIAGSVAAQDKRIKALVSMEGMPPRDIRYKGLLKIPSSMWVSSGTLPFAKENYQVLIDNRQSAVELVELKKFGHNSVTDFPLITPSQFKYEVNSTRGLEISRQLLVYFFESHLKSKASKLDISAEEIVITKNIKP
jgi:alpha-beta hydrolase superfamily lysophospholipase